MTTENLVGILVDEEFNQALRIVVRLCSRVGDHRERSDLVGDSLGFELFLVLSDPCDLRNRRSACEGKEVGREEITSG